MPTRAECPLAREPLSAGYVSVGEGSDGRSGRAPLPSGLGTDMIRRMIEVRIDSIAPELLESPDVMRWAYGLLGRAQTMGFCPEDAVEPTRLDVALLDELAACLQRAGVASEPAARLRAGIAGRRRSRLSAHDLRAMVEALDASPMPEGEWRPARELLGDELLARLVGGVSQSSLRRYASGARQTPDDIAWRLHVAARILAALLGSYNAYGVRRWFERRRGALGGLAPVQVLETARYEDDELLLTAIGLADDLLGAGPAT